MEERVICGASLSYKIIIGTNFLTFIPTYLSTLFQNRISTYILITDTNVASLYATPFLAAMQKANLSIKMKVITPGEDSKCRSTKFDIEDWMLNLSCQRDTCLIALGGGVVGDLTGYVAATYMRGVPFIQIPTSLLACVDSSIGGKTGIDVPSGKNLIGAFHNPHAVYIDLTLLKTLPRREFINGMAEIIKAGAIYSEELFELLEMEQDGILMQEPMLMTKMVVSAVKIKARVVTLDEKEGGLRSILNFGHSIGHGIEALIQPTFLHGECVAIGMVKETELSRLLGHCSAATYGRLLRCIKAYGLPTRVPDNVTTGAILKKMAVDKKNAQGRKRIVLLKSIGSVYSKESQYAHVIEDAQVEYVCEPTVSLLPGSATGSVRVPGSKSISNRVLLLAALGKGTCRIHGLLHSDDTQVMIRALQILGATFDWEEHGAVLVVHGTAGALTSSGQELFLNNAGTAYRFLTTVVTLVQKQNNNDTSEAIVVTGNARMKERPIGPLVDALVAHGCKMSYLEKEGYPPVAVERTGLPGGTIRLAGKVSSQYVSSVLLAAPYATTEVLLQLEEEEPTSLPYIVMTIALMKQFNVDVIVESKNRFRIPTGTYENPAVFHVEVDASSATYPLALAAITCGGHVTVDGLGSSSLQGDAQFYTLLEKMGCVAQQSESCTTVWAPKENLTGIDINMGDMTDAFMTVVALAVVAIGRTNITGIENQRVKECNRIEAMVTELTKLGVVCGELVDGIWVDGVGGDLSSLNSACIDCHEDHRIAMSFAVLGARMPGIVILDKECTDKTYPAFWDDLQNKLGLKLQPLSKTTMPVVKGDTIEETVPCLFLIGMRGVGKSTLGSSVAQRLGMKYLDMDVQLEVQFKQNIGSFVEKNGWAAFRTAEASLLKTLLDNPVENTIVGCGGGVIETPSSVTGLVSYPYVFYLHREAGQVLSELKSQNTLSSRPDLLEEIETTWKRRKPLYEKSASYEFYIHATTAAHDWETSCVELEKMIRFILPKTVVLNQNSAVLPVYRSRMENLLNSQTFFICLTFPDLSLVVESLPELMENVHAVELRVDLLANQDSEFILQQIAILRRVCSLPIIYTVRSKRQGGAFEGSSEEHCSLLQLGLRSGCELLDVEADLPAELKNNVYAKRGNALIISSHHAVESMASRSEIQTMFRNCLGKDDTPCHVSVVKVVVKAFDAAMGYVIHDIAKEMKLPVPYIALCTTECGKISRVLNEVLTPVTHPSLPSAAAPGQMSALDLMATRARIGLLEGKEFYLFGSPIGKSPSPAMHNASFAYQNRKDVYGLCETTGKYECYVIVSIY